MVLAAFVCRYQPNFLIDKPTGSRNDIRVLEALKLQHNPSILHNTTAEEKREGIHYSLLDGRFGHHSGRQGLTNHLVLD